VALDVYLPRASLLPQLLDRIGAGVIGFGTSFLITGLVAICVQLVPWGSGFIGYERFDKADPAKQNELMLKPDRVTARFVAALSNGAFSGPVSFTAAHPDLVSELGWIQSVPRGVRRGITRDSVKFVDGGPTTQLYDLVQKNQSDGKSEATLVEPKSGYRYIHATISAGEETKDSDDRKRYSPASVRLVGTVDDEPLAFPGIGVLDPDMPNRYIRRLRSGEKGKDESTAGMLFDVPGNGQVDVAFEVPEKFQPSFVAYKLGGRAPFDRSRMKRSAEPDDGAVAAATKPGASGATPAPAPGGRVSGVKIKFGGSHFGDALPMTMTAYIGGADVQNGVLNEGNLQGEVDAQGESKPGSNGPVSKFAVPADKALLHLNVESLKAGSTLGQALNFAVQTVENYILEDDQGNQLTPVGKYAIAEIGGNPVIEVQYQPEVGGRVQPFSRIKSDHLKGDYQLVYLYLMDHGRKAVHFKPSGGKKSTDLSGENLVAP
jgi:hypothetical protein